MKYVTLIVLALFLMGADDCRSTYTYSGLPAEGKKACKLTADYEHTCVVDGQLYTCIRESDETEYQCAKAGPK